MCLNFYNRKSADDDPKGSCTMSSPVMYDNEHNIIGLADDDPKGS